MCFACNLVTVLIDFLAFGIAVPGCLNAGLFDTWGTFTSTAAFRSMCLAIGADGAWTRGGFSGGHSEGW